MKIEPNETELERLEPAFARLTSDEAALLLRACDACASSNTARQRKRIRIASSKTVTAPQPAEPRGKGPVNKGAQAGKKDEDPKERRKTLTRAILNAIGTEGIVKLFVGGG